MARVLIVEPEPDLRMFAQQALSELGHEPVLIGNVAPADQIHVLMLATSPTMVELARRLRRTRPQLPIVVVGTRPAGQRVWALEPAVHLTKPYTLAELQRALEQALDSGGDHPPASGTHR